MTIVNADGKAVEWVVGSWLAGDEVALQEIKDGADMHSDNQVKFNLPSRLIAKVFLFRTIFGGSAYSFANDPDFMSVSTSKKFWERVIEAFHEKYQGWSKFWVDQLRIAISDGQIVSPLGRIWEFKQVQKYNGDWGWPVTTIQNWPVQGTSADLMCLSRVMFKKRFDEEKIQGKLITTVHDSIVADVEDYETARTTRLFHEVFREVPGEIKRLFGVEFPIPFRVEVSVGSTMGNLQEYKI
jgi:DNA polymerase I